MSINIHEKIAKPISYGKERTLNSIKYIVIHYTGNKGDTAEGNAKYFATSNTRQAGAHFFVDKKGVIYKSINMNRVAWAVGGIYSKSGGAGVYYGKCTNANSVSIELCDCINDVGWEQMLAVRELVQYIQKNCPNAKTIIRHWDTNGKNCPAPMVGKNNKKWEHLYNKIVYNYQYKAKVIKDAAIRSSNGVKPNNKIGTVNIGDTVKISKVVGSWGRLLNKKNGKWQWISLKKVKEI